MSELNEMKKKLVEMLAAFHQICEEHEIRYYIAGGTMLGAARHQGFIPWDDDIDVVMPRPDYERFTELYAEKQIGKYYVETAYSKDKKFRYAYTKLYDTTTTLIEEMSHYLKRGIFIDIFPLDGVGNSMEEAKKNLKSTEIRKRLLSHAAQKVSPKRAWYKNMVLVVYHFVMEPFEKKLCISISNLCGMQNYDDCEYVANKVGFWGSKEIMPKRVFGTPTRYQFEHLLVYGPEHYDEYLTKLYGDWTKLPPAEKRMSHHDYYLDLNTPYMDIGIGE